MLVAVVVVSLCSAGDLLRGRIGRFGRAHSHARGGGFVLMICQQGSHHGHDGKVCEQGRLRNLTRRIFHDTPRWPALVLPIGQTTAPKRGGGVSVRYSAERHGDTRTTGESSRLLY